MDEQNISFLVWLFAIDVISSVFPSRLRQRSCSYFLLLSLLLTFYIIDLVDRDDSDPLSVAVHFLFLNQAGPILSAGPDQDNWGIRKANIVTA